MSQQEPTSGDPTGRDTQETQETPPRERTFVPGAGGAVAGRLRALGSDRLALAGLLLIAASLAHRAVVLRSGYFVEDDFLFVARAHFASLDWGYLTDLHKGHLMPGAMLLVYAQTALAPYNWALTATVMLAFQGGAAVGLFQLLREVFGPRPVILAPLVVYLFAPLTVPVLAWWSAALNAVPFQLAIVLSLLWTVRYLRGGEPRHAWLAAGAVVLGMSFSVKAMFLPALLFAVAVAFCTPGRLPRAMVATLDARWRFWLALGALSLGHLALYLSRQGTAEGEGAGLPEPDVAWAMARALLGETFPAGAVGGPLSWGPVTPAGGLLEPTATMVVVAWTVLGALVALTVAYRRRAWRAWVILAGYLVLVDVVPTLIARGRYEGLVGYDPRYVADAALVFAICLALALLPTRQERGWGPVYRWTPPRAAWARYAAILVGAVFVATASYSTHTYAQTLSGDRVRWYLDTVRLAVDSVPPGVGIFARPVPEDIVLPWNGARRLSSYVLPPLADPDIAERIATPRASAQPMVFNDAGFLVVAEPASGSDYFAPPEGEECLPAFDGRSMWPVESLGGPTVAVGLAYTSEVETPATVVVGEAWVDTTLPAAPEGGVWYVPVGGAGTQLLVHTDQEAVCLHAVTHGELAPSVEGNPWDQQEEPQEADGPGG